MLFCLVAPMGELMALSSKLDYRKSLSTTFFRFLDLCMFSCMKTMLANVLTKHDCFHEYLIVKLKYIFTCVTIFWPNHALG